MTDTETAGKSYAAVISRRLSEEGLRRNSVHTRATAVISTSGVIISLLFALERAAGTTLNSLDIRLKLLIGGAVLSFCVAALVAIAVLWPTSVSRTSLGKVSQIIKDNWDTTTFDRDGRKISAEQAIALEEAEVLAKWETSNDDAAVRIRFAFAAEVIGILLVAAMAGYLLFLPPQSV